MASSDFEQSAKPEPTPEQLDRLVVDLKSSDNHAHCGAINELANMGEAASPAAPALAEALKDADSLVRYNAAAALGDMAASAEKRVRKMDAPALAKALTLWRDAQTPLDALHSKEASDRAVFADAHEAAHYLLKALQAAQAGNSAPVSTP